MVRVHAGQPTADIQHVALNVKAPMELLKPKSRRRAGLGRPD